MDIFEALHNRRSIRKFEDKSVSDEDLKAILEATMMAPSAGNAQPWQFVVVTDREKLEAVTKINQYAQMAPKAPVSILVCGDLSLEKYAGYWVQDCSAAIQNMLLAACGKGLGTVWTGIYPMEDRVAGFRELFKLPENVVPLGLIVLGHPAQTPKSESRYRQERIHYNEW
ncbi:nitroreductase family protein [Salidesulfovibrio onnuriiensis]|uniref:nitroreductase family protein n=1 Tax=Salidesulfovibrio onnuriiensis TaxID=2583823 RepID=UPI0011C797FC|nr:nitroreductase family protein [Salidesulfovibrio onnuriiensis]